MDQRCDEIAQRRRSMGMTGSPIGSTMAGGGWSDRRQKGTVPARRVNDTTMAARLAQHASREIAGPPPWATAIRGPVIPVASE